MCTAWPCVAGTSYCHFKQESNTEASLRGSVTTEAIHFTLTSRHPERSQGLRRQAVTQTKDLPFCALLREILRLRSG